MCPLPRAEKPQQDGRPWNSGCAVLERLWRDTPCTRANEKPQQDSRRGEIGFKIKSHTHQKRSEGSNIPCAHQDPETPRRLRSVLGCLLWRHRWVSSGLPQGRGFWVQQTWVRHEPSWRRSPLTPPESRQNLHGTGKQGLGGTDRTLCTRTQEKTNDRTGDRPRLARECPEVSGGGLGLWWPAAGSGELSVTEPAWDLLPLSSLPPP